jgi:hypothetical protein
MFYIYKHNQLIFPTFTVIYTYRKQEHRLWSYTEVTFCLSVCNDPYTIILILRQ